MRRLKGRRIVVASGAMRSVPRRRRIRSGSARLIVGDIATLRYRTVAAIEQRAGLPRGSLRSCGRRVDPRLVAACVRGYGGIEDSSPWVQSVRDAAARCRVTAMESSGSGPTVSLIGHALMQAALPAMVSQRDGDRQHRLPRVPWRRDDTGVFFSKARHRAPCVVARRWADNIAQRRRQTYPDRLPGSPEQGSARRSAATAASPRLGEPEDIAATIAFLLSADAEWITGQVFGVNGGHTFRE
jgi:hypothetical protein